MRTDEYVKYSFENHFHKFKHRNIVIYGTGPNTKVILEHFSDYNIVGLMDAFKKEEAIFGKPLLTFEDVRRLNVDLIIIISNKWSLKTVYNRIRNFCYSNQIPLYGINGKNLFDFFGSGHITQNALGYFGKYEEDLIKQIDEHDIISFDIFDTIIMRKTLYPMDVFDLVGDRAKKFGLDFPDFRKIRLKAEANNPDRGTNIFGIYKYLQTLTGISNAEREQLQQLEIEIEKQVIIRREKMVEILEYACKKGKRVYLISDMYLPRNTIEEILTNLGIHGYEDIFVSCDYVVGKCHGLFDIFKEKVPGHSYLHIGDNDLADGVAAENAGIDSFLIHSAFNLMQLSSYGSITKYFETVNDRSLVGLCIARVFNNPFSLSGTRGKPKVDNLYDVGYLFIGAIITNLVIWLINKLNEGKYENILFSARDGYLIQKLYDTARGELNLEGIPEGHYFHVSRKLSTLASMESEEDITWLAKYSSEYLPEMMIKSRFDLADDEVIPYDDLIYPDMISYALAHKEKIYAKSAKIRKNFMRYMENLELKHGEKYALFDFCAIGTAQYFLSKIIPFDVEGLYMCRYFNDENMVSHIDAKSLFSNLGSYSFDSYFFGHYLVFETMITSFSPSVISMDENGKPIYAAEVRSENQLKYVETMQSSIQDYFNEYIKTLYVKNKNINKEVSDMILNLMDEEYTDQCSELFDNITLIDDMGRGTLEIKQKLSE
jgi:predicted HAD superfamily hydrolase